MEVRDLLKPVLPLIAVFIDHQSGPGSTMRRANSQRQNTNLKLLASAIRCLGR
jgi:hypothetical protein